MSPQIAQPLLAIVDDNPFMAQLVSDMLSSCNIDSEVFANGLDLLKSANLPRFKTIILDLSLPDIDGIELMTKLATGPNSSAVLLISGHNPSVVRAAKLYGREIGLTMRGALSKPFSRADLFAALGLPT
jgi:CheY-like chemotaxis protein